MKQTTPRVQDTNSVHRTMELAESYIYQLIKQTNTYNNQDTLTDT